MSNTTITMLQELRSLPALAENEERIRELSCKLLALSEESERYDILCECRKKIRKLQNEKCITARECELQNLDIGKLIENLILCAEVLATQAKKSFSCNAERQMLCCSPSLIIDAFLNLLSNSVKFSSSENITVSLFSKGDSEFIIIENGGEMPFGELERGCGINAASSCARLHKGRLLYAASGGKVKAAMSISRKLKSECEFSIPDYSSYLTDEFSPVYIGLSDI